MPLKANSKEWDYERKGPDVWFKDYKECAGSMQSPIDIHTTDLRFDSELRSFIFSNYDQIIQWNIENNGENSI